MRLELEDALGLVRLDGWLLGALREGRLRVLAGSRPGPHRPYRHLLPLTAPARACLHRRRPLTLCDHRSPTLPGHAGAACGVEVDRELDCRALIYAPVALPGRRPVGLLLAGRRAPDRFIPEETDYVAAVAVALTPAVVARDCPLTRLTALERTIARMVGQGLSVSEIASALQVEGRTARDLVGGLMRKLSLRSPRQLADIWPDGSAN